MSTLNNILQRWGSSVQSGACLTNSRVRNLVCATIFGGLALCGGSAKAAFTPYNVLVNPGAESGDLTGWTTRAAVGYVYVVSTNGTIPNSGSSNFLAHSGSHTFQMFNTTADSVAIYQDFAAISNSLWSASCWAICYASNYFQPGANAHMQVVFYDVSNNVVPYTNTTSYGVLGSQFLDPVDLSGIGVTWTIVPPPAIDTNGWMFLQPTNLFQADPATEANYDSTGYPTNLVAPPGTAYVRYQLEFDNTVYAGGDVYFDDCALTKLNQSDPDITNAPVAVQTYKGLSASFSVVTTHTSQYPGEKLTYQWQYNGTNLPAAGGVNDIAGNTTSTTLSFTNLQVADAGLYDVVVTVKSTTGNYTNSIRSVPVPLTVLALSPLQKANAIGPNGGFEGAPAWSPWEPFNGCYFASSNNVYGASTTPVNVYEGNWCVLVGANGDVDDGFHHAFAIAPGSVLKVGGYAYISSSNDFAGLNTERMQIWFLTASGAPSTNDLVYESSTIYGLDYTNSPDHLYTNVDVSSPMYGQVMLHDQLPRDRWCYMGVTNITTQFFTSASPYPQGSDQITNTLRYGCFQMPADAVAINYQVYENVPATGGVAADAVYWDQMLLLYVLPVTNLTASISGNKINLSFSARAGLDYAIQYTSNLGDTNWNTLMITNAPMSWQNDINATNDTFYPLTVSDSLTAAQSRFYRVQAQ